MILCVSCAGIKYDLIQNRESAVQYLKTLAENCRQGKDCKEAENILELEREYSIENKEFNARNDEIIHFRGLGIRQIALENARACYKELEKGGFGCFDDFAFLLFRYDISLQEISKDKSKIEEIFDKYQVLQTQKILKKWQECSPRDFDSFVEYPEQTTLFQVTKDGVAFENIFSRNSVFPFFYASFAKLQISRAGIDQIINQCRVKQVKSYIAKMRKGDREKFSLIKRYIISEIVSLKDLEMKEQEVDDLFHLNVEPQTRLASEHQTNANQLKH